MRSVLVAVAAVVIVAVVLTMVWLIDPFGWRSPSTTSSNEKPAVNSIQATTPLSEADAVAAALVALTKDPAAGAATDIRADVIDDDALPPGSKLEPDITTWGPDGIGGGTMDVVLSAPGRADTRFVAVMVYEQGAWKVLGTVEQTEIGAVP